MREQRELHGRELSGVVRQLLSWNAFDRMLVSTVLFCLHDAKMKHDILMRYTQLIRRAALRVSWNTRAPRTSVTSLLSCSSAAGASSMVSWVARRRRGRRGTTA